MRKRKREQKPVRRSIHETLAVGRPDSAAIRSPKGRFWEIGGGKGEGGKRRARVFRREETAERGRKRRITKDERRGNRENDRVTSLRSRVRRRASRCQIYRRVLDGACLRLLISPVAFNVVPDVTHVGRTVRPIVGVSHEFVIVAKTFVRDEYARDDNRGV